jgi:hypothetical protein
MALLAAVIAGCAGHDSGSVWLLGAFGLTELELRCLSTLAR